MATPQALGSGLAGYNPFLPSDTNAKLRQIQLQQQLGQELQQQGLTPINTNNRQIGNIGYAISPTEGIAKLAQALVGGYEQNDANNKYADALKNMGGTSGQSGAPSANMMAALYPEEAAKAMLGDHRPGASYWTPGGMQQSPTDLQINTGTTPNSPQQPSPPMPMPPSQGDPGGGAPAPQVPVQGPVPAAPIPGVPSTAPDPLAQYRQANGMATPPIDPQRQAMGLPTGSNIPMGNPQVNASQLSAPPVPPQPASSVPLPNVPQGTLPPQTALPTPMPGESPLHFQARLDVAKDIASAGGKAQAEVGPAAEKAGTSKTAEENASNLVEAQKAQIAFQNQLPGIRQTINHLIDISPHVSYMPGATEYHHLMNDAQSGVNADFHQGLNSLKTFGTQFAATPGMGRMDLPIIQAAQGATSPESGGNPSENKAYLLAVLKKMDQREGALSGTASDMQNPAASVAKTPVASGTVTHMWTPNGIVPVGQQ